MTLVLLLLVVQGAIGAFDTLYYHEWRAKLPARWSQTAPELKLHALRDCLYAVLFATLPWLEWRGSWVIVLAAILCAEIVLTMTDFIVEIRVRKPLGDVFAGERVTHAVMAIIYGAMLANLVPMLVNWWPLQSSLEPTSANSAILCWSLSVMAVGVFLSGARDYYAALGMSHGGWPWRIHESDKSE